MKSRFVKELWICEHCNKSCDDPLQTIIVKGNITIANYDNDKANIGAGIIGRPYDKPVDFADVLESAFHSTCFVKSIMKTMDLSNEDID